MRRIDADGVAGGGLSTGRRAWFDPYPPRGKIEVFRGVLGHMWWVGDVGPRRVAATVPSVGKR